LNPNAMTDSEKRIAINWLQKLKMRSNTFAVRLSQLIQ
jgi:hypothetical protein